MAKISGRYDTKKVKEEGQKLKGGDNSFLYANKINGEIVVRVMPAHSNLPTYWIQVTRYFIQGKSFICPSTFGQPSIIEEEKERVLARLEKTDPQQYDLALKIMEDYKKWNKKNEVLMNVVEFDFKEDDIPELWVNDDRGVPLNENEAASERTQFARAQRRKPDYTMRDYLTDLKFDIKDVKNLGEVEPIDLDKVMKHIVDGKVKIFSCSPSLASAIDEQLNDKMVLTDSEFLGTDQYDGVNLTVKKTGEKLKTRYSAQIHKQKMEMPEELYDTDKIPDIVKVLKEGIKSEIEMRKAVRAALADEPIEDEEGEDNKKEEVKETRRPARRAVMEEDEEEEDDFVGDATKG